MKRDVEFSSLIDHETIEGLLTQEFFFSKNQIKKFLKKKFLSRTVKRGDVIVLPLNLVNHSLVNPVCQLEMPIIHEDEQVVVLNKVDGIHGHPQSYLENNTVLNFLRARGVYSSMNMKEYEKGLLYRLDSVTSGVLIYAKSIELALAVRDDFSRFIKGKTYLALSRGRFDREGRHFHKLQGSGAKGSKVIERVNGIECFATYKLAHYDEEKNISEIEISLETGFRHQIRAQLSLLGFPIVGDTLYGGEEADRVYLHALRYEVQLDDESQSFECLPLNGDYWKTS